MAIQTAANAHLLSTQLLLFSSGKQTQKDNNDGIVIATHGNLNDPFINKDGTIQW